MSGLMAMWDSAIGSPNRGAAAAHRYPAGAVDVRVGALTARARVQVLAFRHPALALIEAATDLPGRMLLSWGAIRNRLDQDAGSGHHVKIGRFGFWGHWAATWSSCRQKMQRAMARALPVKASLYNLGSVTDQLRSFLARASRRNCLSYETHLVPS